MDKDFALSAYLWKAAESVWQPQIGWPANDRALNYGDGLFETMRFNARGELPLAKWHWQRLGEGLAALNFPKDSLAVIAQAFALLPMNLRLSAGKLLVSRGVGERGYLPPQQPQVQLLWQPVTAPTWAIMRFPHGFCTQFAQYRLACMPRLAGIKHLNRLEQVLIRQEFPADCQEMVVMDAQDFVIEGCMSNIFSVKDGQLYTPPIDNCGVNGVVRRWLCAQQQVTQQRMTAEDLLQSEALFMTNTLNGLIPLAQLGTRRFESNLAGWQYVKQLQQALEAEFC